MILLWHFSFFISPSSFLLLATPRQVFALTKERDALKRTAAAASAGGSTAAEVAQLRGQLHKKEELVAQVGGRVCMGMTASRTAAVVWHGSRAALHDIPTKPNGGALLWSLWYQRGVSDCYGGTAGKLLRCGSGQSASCWLPTAADVPSVTSNQ